MLQLKWTHRQHESLASLLTPDNSLRERLGSGKLCVLRPLSCNFGIYKSGWVWDHSQIGAVTDPILTARDCKVPLLLDVSNRWGVWQGTTLICKLNSDLTRTGAWGGWVFGLVLLYSLMHRLCLEPCLTHSRCSVTFCRINKWVDLRELLHAFCGWISAEIVQRCKKEV